MIEIGHNLHMCSRKSLFIKKKEKKILIVLIIIIFNNLACVALCLWSHLSYD